jgi:hypothetical protein
MGLMANQIEKSEMKALLSRDRCPVGKYVEGCAVP